MLAYYVSSFHKASLIQTKHKAFGIFEEEKASVAFQTFDSVPDFLFDQSDGPNTNTNINQRTTIISVDRKEQRHWPRLSEVASEIERNDLFQNLSFLKFQNQTSMEAAFRCWPMNDSIVQTNESFNSTEMWYRKVLKFIFPRLYAISRQNYSRPSTTLKVKRCFKRANDAEH